MGQNGATSSAITTTSTRFPKALTATERDGTWNNIRVGQQEEDDPQFDISGHDYKILNVPYTATEMDRTLYKFLSLSTLKSWQVLVTFSTITNYMLAIYCIFIIPEYLKDFFIVYAMCDFIYFIDVMLSILHRYWRKVNQKFQLKHKPVYLLLIDVLSLLPQELIWAAILGSAHWSLSFYRCITFVRLYRVLQVRRWRWCFICYVVLCSMVLYTTVCIWYYRFKLAKLRELEDRWAITRFSYFEQRTQTNELL